jgi:hypothetical protein
VRSAQGVTQFCEMFVHTSFSALQPSCVTIDFHSTLARFMLVYQIIIDGLTLHVNSPLSSSFSAQPWPLLAQ